MQPKLLKIIGLMLLVAAFAAGGVVFYLSIPSVKYKRIRMGMSLSEVEAILGPGEKIRRSSLPRVPPYVKPLENGENTPIIDGDEFWVWWATGLGWRSVIYIGLRNGKVCDKHLDVGGYL